VLFPISLVSFEELREWRCFDADTGKDSAREIRSTSWRILVSEIIGCKSGNSLS
jgi:hypothetical protein